MQRHPTATLLARFLALWLRLDLRAFTSTLSM